MNLNRKELLRLEGSLFSAISAIHRLIEADSNAQEMTDEKKAHINAAIDYFNDQFVKIAENYSQCKIEKL